MIPGVLWRALLPHVAENSAVFLRSSSAAASRSFSTNIWRDSLSSAQQFAPGAILRHCSRSDRIHASSQILSRFGSSQSVTFRTASRCFSVSQRQFSDQPKNATTTTTQESREESHENTEDQDFQKSERATRAAQVNLSAKLSKEGKGTNKAGLSEVWRLIKVARPEVRWLGIAFVFLVISSSVTMLIPFSVGRILDLATKGDSEDIRLFGFTMTDRKSVV